jgi:ankyrin repeat protein
MQSRSLTEALIYAAEHGDLAAVRAFLVQGADANWRDLTPFQCPVLACAAGLGQTAVVRYLLGQGADVNATDVDGESALTYAVTGQHRNTVLALLDAPNLRVDGGPNAPELFQATLRGDLAVLLDLLSPDADANAMEAGGLTALMGASALSHEDIVDALLERGGSLPARDASGNTALMWAAIGGDAAVVGTLLRRGADVNAADHRGVTALMGAAATGHIQVVGTLLAAGSNVNATDQWGSQTALCRARTRNHDAIIQLLLRAGATE